VLHQVGVSFDLINTKLSFARQASIHDEDGLKETISFIMSVVCFLLDNSPRHLNFICQRFEHSVPSSYLPAYEDGTDSVFQNVSI
jgi:hypothetical protein